MRRGANADDSAFIAEKISKLDDAALALFLKESYASKIFASIKHVLVNRGYESEADAAFEYAVKAMLSFGCRKIRAYDGTVLFRVFLAALCREKALEFLKKYRGFKGIQSKNVDIALHSSDFLNGVNPDLEYLSLERRELFVSASDIISDEYMKLKPKERLVYSLRIGDGMSFKDMTSLLKIESSSREFERIIKKMKTSSLARINRAIDNYFR